MDSIQTNYNEQSKHTTISWRKENPERYKELSQKHALDYYYRHRERILENRRNKYSSGEK